jgi:flagellar basal body-associated protein FliL
MAAVLGNPRGLAFLMVGALVGVMGGFFVLRTIMGGASAAPAPAVIVRKEFEGPTYPIKERVYNLADTNARRYLKLAISLQFAAESDKYEKAKGEAYTAAVKEFNLEVNPKLDVIQDTLTSVVSSKTMAVLLTQDGKDQLKQEIASRLNTALNSPELHITKVYFTDFVVQ